MDNVYHLTTIHDLLKVPADRREACMHDLLIALLMHELAFGEQAQATAIGTLAWMDDGKHDVEVTDEAGDRLLSLHTTAAA